MRRWHEEAAVYRRQQRVDRAHGRDLPLGWYRKKHALDCGNPRCYVCHSDKLDGDLTRQERVAAERWAEQMDEV